MKIYYGFMTPLGGERAEEARVDDWGIVDVRSNDLNGLSAVVFSVFVCV